MKNLFNLLQNSNSQYRALTKKNAQYQIKLKRPWPGISYIYDILQFIDLLYCMLYLLYHEIEFSFDVQQLICSRNYEGWC